MKKREDIYESNRPKEKIDFCIEQIKLEMQYIMRYDLSLDEQNDFIKNKMIQLVYLDTGFKFSLIKYCVKLVKRDKDFMKTVQFDVDFYEIFLKSIDK